MTTYRISLNKIFGIFKVGHVRYFFFLLAAKVRRNGLNNLPFAYLQCINGGQILLLVAFSF